MLQGVDQRLGGGDVGGHRDVVDVAEPQQAGLVRLDGFREIRIPTFEHTELFDRSVGDTTDVVQKEMYTFTDKGDRSVTLRPEGPGTGRSIPAAP